MPLRIVPEEELQKMSYEDLKQLKQEYWQYCQGNELPDWVPWIVTNLGHLGSYIDTDFALSIHWNRENRQWSVYSGGRQVMADGVFVPGDWMSLFEELYAEATERAEESRRQRLEIERQKLINTLRPSYE